MELSGPSPHSPCVKICVVDPVSGLCIGCGRTVAEIAAWSELDAEARRAVVAGLSQRLEAARSRVRRSGRVGPRGRG
jgi:predicted Fe-S protein YdhL (DUF1289 family)